MRSVKRSDADSPPVRTRRRQRLYRRMIYTGVTMMALGAATTGGWYAERAGIIKEALAPVEARIATLAIARRLTVQSVEVEGRHRADRQAILDALSVRRGSPILSVDLDAAKTRLEALAWVRSASIERQLPDGIYVRLVEREPLAVWQHHRQFDLIDQDGAVIPNTRAEDFPALPQIVGEGAPSAASDLVDMLASEPDLARHVTAATRVGGRRWNVDLDNGIEVALPEESPGAAWHRLAALDRSDRLLERDITEIDMRLSDRLVLRLSPNAAKTMIKKTRPTRSNV